MKRFFDLLLCVSGVIVLSPVILIVFFAVKCDGGPALFLQERVGRYGKKFRIYKFRTMVIGAEKSGGQITAGSDHRITKTGRLLRKTKIDEIPQLLNVIMGQMSLVGPRPEVTKYVEKWPEEKRKNILSVRPGVTDFAAIIYRNEEEILSKSSDPEKTYLTDVMPKKLELYEKYILKNSLWLDVRIVFATALIIIGINPSFLLREVANFF